VPDLLEFAGTGKGTNARPAPAPTPDIDHELRAEIDPASV